MYAEASKIEVAVTFTGNIIQMKIADNNPYL